MTGPDESASGSTEETPNMTLASTGPSRSAPAIPRTLPFAPSVLTYNLTVAYCAMNEVFAAIADPIRRGILDRLQQEGPLSVKDLAAPLDITRQAVTKHLDVLEAAGLVEREMRGRERVSRLRADRLQVVDDWVDGYSVAWDERLARLVAHLERDRKDEDDHEEVEDG